MCALSLEEINFSVPVADINVTLILKDIFEDFSSECVNR